VLAVDRRRRVGIADVPAGTVAGPPRAVIPATRILRDVAAEGALVPNLRRGHERGRFRQQPEVRLDCRVIGQVGQRRRRADLEAAVGGLPHASQRLDATEIDDDLAALVAVLEPVEAVEAAGEDPRIPVVLLEQRNGVVNRCRLKELEDGHYVVDDSHGYGSINSKFKMQNAHSKCFGDTVATETQRHREK
jgi:hypothetical protein